MRNALAVMLLVAVALSGCSSGGEHHGGQPKSTGIPAVSEAAAAVKDADVSVTLGEWSVLPEHQSLQAGEVTFTAKNDGQHAHELAVVRTDLDAAKLPTQDDGTVDEEELDVGGRTDLLDPGGSGKVTVDLEAGDYVLMCNVVDDMGDEEHVHYELGMRTPLRVAPAAE